MSQTLSTTLDPPAGQEKAEVDMPPPSHHSQKDLSIASRAWSHMLEDVRPSGFVELELVLLTFFTGIQDAISFPDYHCFASNQTGNTVFLFVALVLPYLDGDQFYVPNIGAALGFFLFGGWVTGQISHIVGPRMRLWLVTCNFIQSALVFGAAGLQFRAKSPVLAFGLKWRAEEVKRVRGLCKGFLPLACALMTPTLHSTRDVKELRRNTPAKLGRRAEDEETLFFLLRLWSLIACKVEFLLEPGDVSTWANSDGSGERPRDMAAVSGN
ncbi:hypothetical protein NUW58_g2151 [Xylaria curta]|uniref:Uncharacterized protein n=1 Tax=Xylaria curta TaxID=42375 RepID=A0ACC1PI54_9PEZI|nr:hypothetical protein NUW58_g2151 [Xylaria curta]